MKSTLEKSLKTTASSSHLQLHAWRIVPFPNHTFVHDDHEINSRALRERASQSTIPDPVLSMLPRLGSEPMDQKTFEHEQVPKPVDGRLANDGAPPAYEAPSSPPGRSVTRHPAFRRSSGLQSSPASSPSSKDIHESPRGENSPWSSAVGTATLGKSGRVIERLMADIDRLKRELNAEIQHRHEIEKQEQASKTMIRSLSAENSNLSQAKEVDAGMLRRRDRLIEELRGDLRMERERRTKAEEQARAAHEREDEIKMQSAQEVASARDVAKHATTHAHVLQESHKQLSNEYRQRLSTIYSDFRKLELDRDNEVQKLGRLDVVVEQFGQELEKSNKINCELAEGLKRYQEESDERMETVRADNIRRDAEEAELRARIESILEEARWLLNLGMLRIDKDA